MGGDVAMGLGEAGFVVPCDIDSANRSQFARRNRTVTVTVVGCPPWRGRRRPALVARSGLQLSMHVAYLNSTV